MAGKLQQLFRKYIYEPEHRYGGVTFDSPDKYFWNTNRTKSGRSVDSQAALTISAIYRAVSIKSGLISSLPFQVFEKTATGRRQSDHPAARLLSRAPNGKMSKVVFFDRALQHYDLEGNHFALIIRNGIGRVERLELLDQDDVKVIEGEKSLIYKVEGKEGFVDSENMIHVPNMGGDYVGKSVISYMREDAALMLDVRDYGTSFYGNGGKPAGLLIPKMAATPAQRQEMKESFAAAKKQGGEVALPVGWEYKEVGIPPKDADWVLTNDINISTVARWFGVPTQKLGDSAVKYSNVEFMGIEFLQDTISPIAAKFEAEYTNKLFILPGEQNLYAEMNLDAYLRADSQTKAEQFSKYIQNGIKTPNEIRKYNNDEPLEGGDDLLIQGATVPLSMQKQAMAAKQPVPRKSLRKRIEEDVKKGLDPQLIIEGIFGNDGRGYNGLE